MRVEKPAQHVTLLLVFEALLLGGVDHGGERAKDCRGVPGAQRDGQCVKEVLAEQGVGLRLQGRLLRRQHVGCQRKRI